MTRIRFGGCIPRVRNSQPCERRAPLSVTSVPLNDASVKRQHLFSPGEFLSPDGFECPRLESRFVSSLFAELQITILEGPRFDLCLFQEGLAGSD